MSLVRLHTLGQHLPSWFFLGLLMAVCSPTNTNVIRLGISAFGMGPRPMGSGAMAGNGAHAGGTGGASGNLAFGFDGFAGAQPSA